MLRPLLSLLALGTLSGCVLELHHDTGTTDLDEPFHSVVIDVDTGTVELYGGAESPRMDWDLHWNTGCPDVSKVVVDGVLYIEAHCPVGAIACRSELILHVPEGVDVDARLTTGELVIVDAGAVTAALTTGDLEVHGAVEELDLLVTTGRIEADGLAVDFARAEVTTGGIELRLDEPFVQLEAQAVTGEVQLDVPEGCYDLDLDVVTGSVDTSGVDCGCGEVPGIRARVVTGSISVWGS
jgi:hypothetical protein